MILIYIDNSKTESFSEEVKRLKKLLEKGDITEEVSKAKEKFLNVDINSFEDYGEFDLERGESC